MAFAAVSPSEAFTIIALLLAEASAYIYSILSPGRTGVGHLVKLTHMVLQLHGQNICQHGGKPFSSDRSWPSGSDTIIQHTIFRGVSHAQRQDIVSSFSTSVTCSSLPRFSMNTDNCFTNINVPAFPKSVSFINHMFCLAHAALNALWLHQLHLHCQADGLLDHVCDLPVRFSNSRISIGRITSTSTCTSRVSGC